MIKFIEKDNIWQNEITNYWFEVDGVNYAISDSNSELTLLDDEGGPIDDCNDFDGIKDKLIPLYKIRIND